VVIYITIITSLLLTVEWTDILERVE
jgi:hypothetical protein